MGLLSGIEGLASDLVGKIPGVSAVGALASHIPGLQSVGDFLAGNGGKNALGVAEGANAAYLQNKSSGYADQALKSAQGAYDQTAPLRSAGVAGMLNPGQGIAAKIAALPNNNPFTRGMPQQPTVAPVGIQAQLPQNAAPAPVRAS